MPIGDLPSFSTSTTTGYNYGLAGMGTNQLYAVPLATTSVWIDSSRADDVGGMFGIDDYRRLQASTTRRITQDEKKEKPMAKNPLRVVRVFLVDPDERVPADKRVLYAGSEITTDATDQELYFDIDVNAKLEEHNKFRTGTEYEEKGTEGAVLTRKLKPIRIRDLVMHVAVIATF